MPPLAAASLALTGLAAAAALPARAAEPVRIRVEYRFQGRMVDGRPVATPYAVGATLAPGGKVVDSWQGARGSGGSESRLGNLWRVVGPSELMRVVDYPNNRVVTRVVVQGRTCRASVEAQLKPGRSTYTLRRSEDRSMVELAEIRYDDVRCAIE